MISSEELNRLYLLQEEYLGTEKPVNKLNPLVSVWVITYQHVKYVKDCLDGILKQKTNFEYEIILGEDQSTDGTREVCIDYAKKLKDKIRLFLRDRKQSVLYDKNGNFIRSFNGILTTMSSRGKYIAMCEGDDYWTDPYKLQKQVDFLEANPDYIFTYHNAIEIDEAGNLITESRLPIKCQRDTSSDELKKGFYTLTCTKLYRNIIKEFPKEFFKLLGGDTFSTCMLGQFGKGKYMNDITPSVYRVHSGGIWSQKSRAEQVFLGMQIREALFTYFKKQNDYRIAIFHRNSYYLRSILFLLYSIKSFKIQEIIKACSIVIKGFLNISTYYYIITLARYVCLKIFTNNIKPIL
jgi:glycosyltransferase involved in cell wall biosynthesis